MAMHVGQRFLEHAEAGDLRYRGGGASSGATWHRREGPPRAPDCSTYHCTAAPSPRSSSTDGRERQGDVAHLLQHLVGDMQAVADDARRSLASRRASGTADSASTPTAPDRSRRGDRAPRRGARPPASPVPAAPARSRCSSARYRSVTSNIVPSVFNGCPALVEPRLRPHADVPDFAARPQNSRIRASSCRRRADRGNARRSPPPARDRRDGSSRPPSRG